MLNMATTPKKHVLWQMDFSPNLDSPYFETTTETSMTSTSTLEYVNAQLVAHGFAPSPGLCLDGTSNDNSARVVKCLLGLLGQRVQDMSRMEDLTVKCRTLTYDLERMRSMHGKEVEKSANAEREMNLHKAKHAASIRNLQVAENTQKQTAAELQRTKILLQGVRATYQAEVKKKEKEVERVLDKWQKIADSQTKLSVVQSGMRCANVAVVDGAQVVGKGLGFLDIALEQAEQARNHLSDENLMLRKLILKTINELQSLRHKARHMLLGDSVLEEPSQLTMTTLFVPSTPAAVSEKVSGVLNSLEQSLSKLGAEVATPHQPDSQVSKDEVQRLQDIIIKLKEDLATSQKQALAQMTETRKLFDEFAADQRHSTRENDEISVELMTAPQRDEERDRLERLRAELDLERQRFTEATIKLGKEKAELAAERFRLIEEKRSWEVENMLADLSATPGSLAFSKSNHSELRNPSPKKSPRKSPHKSPHKSPRKSPGKRVVVGKAGGSRAHRVSRTSPASPGKVVSYETELILPRMFPPLKSLAPPSSLLPTSFVLPPPSPRASLPTGPVLPLAREDSPVGDKALLSPPSLEVSPPSDDNPFNNPVTPAPIRRPFPVAKPFAQKMVHAYSPAHPSPLSRILMLADSPTTPPKSMPEANNSLSPVLEGDSQDSLERAVLGIATTSAPSPPALSLEDIGCDLGTENSPPEQHEVRQPRKGPLMRGRVFVPDTNGKKTKTTERTRSSPVWEKENRNFGKQKVFSKPSSGDRNVARKASPVPTSAAPSKPALKSTKMASTVSKEKPVAKPSLPGGPRRVPINSADAPAMGKVWKG